MFETAEVGHAIAKETYNQEVPKVRTALLAAQRELANAPLAVVVIVGGVEGAGKSETVNLLLEWMDARGMETHSLWRASDEEQERPPMWRFWRVLPAQGRLGIFFGSWYTFPIIDRVFKRASRADFQRSLERIRNFEEMLFLENILVVKFWMHLSKQDQKDRFKALDKDPRKRWRITKLDRKFLKRVDRFREVSEEALQKTDATHAPWHVVEAGDARYRNLTVAQTLLQALRGGLERWRTKAPTSLSSAPAALSDSPGLFQRLDLTRALTPDEFDERSRNLQGKLGTLVRRLPEEKRSLILVFEGPDAAGKGGAIRRLTTAMDARDYQVICVGAPTDEERSHPYLWRFWRHLPPRGRVTIYDRSWYGRVLVERVEGFCSPEEWQRAYGEINAFEEQLTDFGIIVIKFWLAVSPEEQLRRFKDRQTTPFKQYKLTEEDWRNRLKWNAYSAAAETMIAKTSGARAPWTLVEADNKDWARVQVLGTAVNTLRRELNA
jgi:AMP-polyphosphate phosphotransferase